MAKRDDDDADDAGPEDHIQPEPRRRPPPRRQRDDEEEGDEEPRPRRRSRSGSRREDDAVSTIIPYHNGMALAAYYVGVFSLVPIFALLLGPLGVIFGIVGLRRVNANPEIKGTGHAIAGIVLGGLTTLLNYGVVIFIVAAAASRR
jgi:hypothetical protein